jgi:hypothetical protein
MGTAAVSCGHRHSRCVRVYVSESASSANRLLGGWQEMGFGVCSYKSGALVRERELLPCRVWDMIITCPACVIQHSHYTAALLLLQHAAGASWGYQ